MTNGLTDVVVDITKARVVVFVDIIPITTRTVARKMSQQNRAFTINGFQNIIAVDAYALTFKR